MTGAPAQEDAVRAPLVAGRALTPRAIVIGLALAAGAAVVAPWNDWFLGNTFLFSNYAPPLVTALLVVVAVAVNPLLGGRRLRTAELALIVALVTSVGGVASSGLMRLWPAAVGGTARFLAREHPEGLTAPLTAAERQDARRAALLRLFHRLDVDGDGVLDPAEARIADFAAADGDGDGRLSAEEFVRAAPADAVAVPAWRWDMPRRLFLGIPPVGDIPQDDAEYQRLVDGFLDGMGGSGAPRVAHGGRVTWIDAAGVRHERQSVLAASLWGEALPGALRLDSDAGRALVGARAGAEVALPGGIARVVAVEPPALPWAVWARALLAWSPLLIGTAVASIALAFIVRRQWHEHERLPYPVAGVALALMEEPAPGTRLPPLLRDRAFWTGALVAGGIVAWRGLVRWHVLSVDVATDIDLIGPDGSPFHDSVSAHQVLDPGGLFHPQLYWSLFAFAFFLPLDLGFSLWACIVLANAAAWALRERTGLGAYVTWTSSRFVGYGAFVAMAALIAWIGRGWYGRVLRAAFARGDAEASAVRGFVWTALAGAGAIAAFFVANGAPLVPALLMTVLSLASLLVLARILAESGIAFIQVPLSIDAPFFALVGCAMPPAALVSLATVGFTLLPDGRESLLPYAADASVVGHAARVPPRRLASLMALAATLGIALAAGSMIANSCLGPARHDGWMPYAHELRQLADARLTLSGGAPPAGPDQRPALLGAAGIGAALVAICGVGRVLFSAWPIHPLAWCVTFTYPGIVSWFSFFAAWLAKLLVMRYGGVGVYRRLRPAAIGLIAGEALAMAVFSLIKIVAWCDGVWLDSYNALPG